MPPVLAAAEDDVGLALVEVLAGDLVLAAPVGGAREERGRAGVGDLGGGDQAGGLSRGLRLLAEDCRGFLFTSTEMAPL